MSVPRVARAVFPGFPHHVTQRGNRRAQTFFSPGDYYFYLNLLREYTQRRSVSVLAYCLMPNHVHMVLVPATKDGLHRVMLSGGSLRREESGSIEAGLPTRELPMVKCGGLLRAWARQPADDHAAEHAAAGRRHELGFLARVGRRPRGATRLARELG